MELELGLKFTRVSDEFTSDLQIAKDRAGALFLSRETDAMFILTAHLKGYRRRNIKIDINEDGSLIAISGEKQTQETVMVGWKVIKKDTEIRGFKKVYRIPNGVILDKIKAKFNEDDSTLTITMPKQMKGIRGTAVEEVKEAEHELVKQGSGNLQIADEKSLDNGEKLKEKVKEGEAILSSESREEDQQKVGGVEERSETKEENHQEVDEQSDVQEGLEEEKNRPSGVENDDRDGGECEHREGGTSTPRGKRCNTCIPLVAGSALLLSFVVFVIQMIRSKSRSSTRRD